MARIRDNFGMFQKTATARIKKDLQATADEAEVNVKLVVADHLLRTYKDNVLMSYGPRSERGKKVAEFNKRQKEKEDADNGYRKSRKKVTYKPKKEGQGGFLDAIDVEIKDNVVKIVIQPNPDESNEHREKPITQEDVYEFLAKGTKGGGAYLLDDGKVDRYGNPVRTLYGNIPTPKHDFELHTANEMKGFIANLKARIENKDPELMVYRYTKKKKPRRTYKGLDVRGRDIDEID